MKIASKGTLAGLAGIIALIAGSVLAQQASPTIGQSAPGQTQAGVSAAEWMRMTPAGVVSEEQSWEPLDSTCSGCAAGCSPSEERFCEVCGGGSRCPADWYLDQHIRIFTRSRPRYETLSLDVYETQLQELQADGSWRITFEGYEATPVVNTRSLSFDVSAGYQTTLGHYLGRDTQNRDHFVEVSYWGLHSWEETVTYNGKRIVVPYRSPQEEIRNVEIGSLVSQFDFPEIQGQSGATNVGREPYTGTVGGFNRADQHRFTYGSDFNNAELNVRLSPRGRADRLVLHPNGKWRRECRPGYYTSYVFGLRYMSIHEAFRWHSQGSIVDSPNTVDVFGDYSVRTHNDLVGLQVGGDYIYRHCKWSWGVRAKAGPFINMADQYTDVTVDSFGDPWTPGDLAELETHQIVRKNEASLMAELGLVGTYKIRPNLVLHAGYEFMWITGLAYAAEQLQFERNPPERINLNGHAYYHGFTMGFQWTH
ncbi:MAG: BBP7 family outer membrane beta-barrel protein [Pirellulales bacterium]|nr:BBP7 family outer membrane beta-barrel protein [Pirellulales bacterium]